MRRFFNYAASAALSVLALASCAKEKLVDNSNGRELHFVVKTAESAPVKSYITSDRNGSYTPGWHKSDEIAIFTGTIAANTKASGTLYNMNEDGTKASFDGVVAAAESGVFKAIYPAGRVTNGLAPKDGAECVGVNLGDPEEYIQNPVAGSFDPLCDVLVSKPTNYNSKGSSVEVSDVYFKRIMSVVKVVLKGADAADQAVSNFTMTADGVTLSGCAKVDVINAKVDSWTVENTFVKAAFAENNKPVINSADNNAFFIVVNPVTLSKGSKLTISAETASHYINKDITLPKDIVFPEGQMAVLNITINKDNLTAKTAESPKYILVKDVTEITAGSEVIIVANGSDYALGTTQNTNNRAAVSITKSSDKSSIDNISSEVQVFTIQTGTKENTVAFFTGQGYIYAASSSDNYLRTQDSIDDNASWTVSISSGGVATITAQGTNTHNLLKKNSNSAWFSCYSSGQSAVSIYKYSITALGQPANLQAVANAEEKTITVTWASVDNAESYKVTCGDETKTTQETSYVFTVPEDGLYEISVVATTSNALFKDSSPATTTIRVGDIKKSKAYFSVNGELSAGTEYEEGASIRFPENPSSPGVEFMGWTTSAIPTPQATAPVFVNTESIVMGTKDITFYAVFATLNGSPATEKLDQTLKYDTWTYSGSTTNKSTYRLFHTDSYIESTEFDLSTLKKVVVYGGTFGGDYNKLTIGDGTKTWKDVTVSSKGSIGTDTFTDGTPLTGKGKLRIISKSGTASSTGVRISKVEIYITEGGYYYSDYCTNVITLSSIAVSGTPTKTEYTVGETFDPTGLTVTGTYTDGSSKEITTGINWSSEPNPLTKGTTSVTVTATVGNLSANYEVTGLKVTAGSGSGEGGGNTPAVGTTLWKETWGNYTGAVSDYTFIGTSMYGNDISNLKYTVDNEGDKIDSTTAGSITSNNLFFLKAAESSFTITGIKLNGVSKIDLSFLTNGTNFSVSYSVDNGDSISLMTSCTKGKNTTSITGLTGSTMTLVFKKTGMGSNNRLDDIEIKVAE